MKTINTLLAGFISLVSVNATAQSISPNVKFADPVMVSGLVPSPGAGETMVEFNWSTSGDTGKSYFEVERSFDGSNFTTIALVLDGFKQSDGTTTCKMKDRSAALAGGVKAYYRLKQVETNGQFSYSAVVKVTLKA